MNLMRQMCIFCICFLFSLYAFAQQQPQAPAPQAPAAQAQQQPPQQAPKKAKGPKSKTPPPPPQPVLPQIAPVPAEQWKTVTDKIYTHQLSNKDTYVYLRVNAAIGESLILEFPEGISLVGDPIIGDLLLLRVETSPSPLLIKVWALLFQGVPENQMYNIKSNIQFRLNTGMTIILNVIVSPPEHASNRIVFDYPEWQTGMKGIQKILSELKTKLQTEYDNKNKELDATVERRAFEREAEQFAEFYMCNSYSNRTEDKLVFLGSDRICRLGDDTILINFIVKNRKKQYFYVKEVLVFQLNGESRVPVTDAYIHLPKTGLKFDEFLEGAIGIKSKDYTTNYAIQVVEEGGLKRTLTLDVGF